VRGAPPAPETVPTLAHRADQGSSSTARRRRSDHVAYAKGDVFEREAETIADLRRRLRQAAR